MKCVGDMKWKEVTLNDVSKYSKERINVDKLTLENYVSTENMLPEKAGKKIARPETIFFNFLYDLSDTDNFWVDESNFTKQTCFVDYQSGQEKGTVKKWFKDKKFAPYFGKGYSKLFNRWKKENIDIVKKFQEDFKKIIYS